ncbi:MAG: cell division ATP-binding protein FtsE [Polycyclovorans sp.]|jgi:cell division transport system ATP-binding protein|nr:cell division ATP-binding protein FtsE [Polycyclovorans sp.]MDP1542632.1 cell division ATP-binding protein FtsE [Polycyclovorans sp.]MEC8848497.1 cell division ATP-binding protein FtsE [Pseudomonadota bacterium]|tara:strand:- start:2405 stop:3106 length:702 start_codon:yes stop_codon:yes gene_type:complete
MNPPLVEFERVTHRYPGGHDVLTDASLRLNLGEMAFLTGASGAGKSTLLKLIARLEVANRGQVRVNGQNVAALAPRHVPDYRQHLGLIFQQFNLLYDRSVFDNVALPLRIQGHADHDIARRVRAALDSVGLLNKAAVMPIRLSGGEQQRVGVARAVVTRPLLILADEPTGNLDHDTALGVMDLFQRYNRAGVSLLIATHAEELIEQIEGYRVFHLDGGHLSLHPSGKALRHGR